MRFVQQHMSAACCHMVWSAGAALQGAPTSTLLCLMGHISDLDALCDSLLEALWGKGTRVVNLWLEEPLGICVGVGCVFALVFTSLATAWVLACAVEDVRGIGC